MQKPCRRGRNGALTAAQWLTPRRETPPVARQPRQPKRVNASAMPSARGMPRNLLKPQANFTSLRRRRLSH